MKVKRLKEELAKYNDDDEILVFRSQDWGANPDEMPEWHRNIMISDEREKLGYLSIVPQADQDVDGWDGCA